MARSAIARKKKVVRAAPQRKRGAKMVGPDFSGWEKMTGQEYDRFQRNARDFYYENYKATDLFPEIWAWMKDNKYSAADIRAAKAQGLGVTVAINCKLLRTGAPDFNQVHADYWTALPGTGNEMRPLSVYINLRIGEAIQKGKALVEEEKKAEQAAARAAKPVRPNIQEIMRERASEAAGEIDAIYDEFINAGSPKDFDVAKRIVNELSTRKILPQHVPGLVKPWERLRAEYVELQAGKDTQLVEGYATYSKMQIRTAIKLVDAIIADLNSYVAIKQATKAKGTRARKPVPVEKIVSKLKYCKAFKDPAMKLDLVGLHPTKLHNSTEAWVYDTKKRKMHHYVADNYTKCLLIKGNTLLGFDKKDSEVKTLRKPGEQIKTLVGSRPSGRKNFKDIKAVAVCPNGRFNKDMIILKAF